MDTRVSKSLALFALVAAVAGVCTGPCAPRDALITIDAVDPNDGSHIPTSTVTITFSGTEERSEAALGYTMSAQLLQRIEGGDWETVAWLWEPDMVIGPWQEGGTLECGYIRDLTAIPFEDVELGDGQNDFWVRLVVTDGHYDNKYWDYDVTYTH